MKYLILSLSAGGGHDAAANALADALKIEGHEAEVYDCFGIISPFQSKLVCGGYLWLVKHLPKLFGVIYNSAYHITSPGHDSVVYKMNTYRTNRLVKFIEAFKPDAIITTHIFAAQQLTYLKKNGKINHWLAGVITDYDVHPFWEETEMNMIFTPHESLSERYRERGVKTAELVASGIPVCPGIAPCDDLKTAKAEAGLETDLKHIVVAGGSMGAGKLPGTVQTLLSTVEEGVQLVVVCGSNRKLKRKFERMHVDEKRLRILGFVRPLHKLIRAADAFISKPGGLSSTEAFNTLCPMIAVHPIQGVESHNADFMKAHGLALCPNGNKEIAEAVQILLKDEIIVNDMKKAMETVVPQNASINIAKRITEETKKA